MGAHKSKNQTPYKKVSFDGNIQQENGYFSRSAKQICAPVVGHQIYPKRKKLSVFKIHVMLELENWYLFRTFKDFSYLDKKLHKAFPEFCLKLPKKRRFGSKYSKDYLQNMEQKLRLYFDVAMQHEHISHSDVIKDFLQLDDPPGPFENTEQSKLHCEILESHIDQLNNKVARLEIELEKTRSKLNDENSSPRHRSSRHVNKVMFHSIEGVT